MSEQIIDEISNKIMHIETVINMMFGIIQAQDERIKQLENKVTYLEAMVEYYSDEQ